ncbi:MAG: hypothetical protein GX326_07130 [Clostridiaceae bacterium]|nr:hypothetical protein [Clostridiaceae bacterium]
MSQKQALKIVGILTLISIVVLVVHGILVDKYPQEFDRAAKNDTILPEQNDEAIADELPINQMQVESTTKNNQNVFSWPYDSAVPIYHQADLEIYLNKVKDENALSGITIYLSHTSLKMEESSDNDDIESSASEQPENDLDSPNNELSYEETSNINEIVNGELTDQEYEEILKNIVTETKNSLEAIGATVIVLDENLYDDLQKSAFVGHDILEDFINELSEQKFKSDVLESLLNPLARIKTSSKNQTFFAAVGVTPEHRLLLDVERQYLDRIFINFRFGNEEQESGSLVRYFGNQSAAIGAQGESISSEMSENPAYIAYDIENRHRLANLTNKNINQLLPALNNDLEQGVKEDIVTSLRLINLNSIDITIGQKGQVFDMQILTSEEQQKVLAETISHSCYEFYCTDLN